MVSEPCQFVAKLFEDFGGCLPFKQSLIQRTEPLYHAGRGIQNIAVSVVASLVAFLPGRTSTGQLSDFVTASMWNVLLLIDSPAFDMGASSLTAASLLALAQQRQLVSGLRLPLLAAIRTLVPCMCRADRALPIHFLQTYLKLVDANDEEKKLMREILHLIFLHFAHVLESGTH